MRLTNIHGLPDPIVRAVTKDPYSKGAADFSVTEIIDAPKIRALQHRHRNEIEEDVSSRVWSLLGRAVHSILEDAAGDGYHAEERLFLDVGGFTLSGGMDLQFSSGNGVDISDYKVTSVFAVKKNKIEWEQQLNIYAHLVRKVKNVEVKSLTIIAICRDWSAGKGANDPDYPVAPIVQVPIKMWTPQEAERYVNERVALHAAAREAGFLNKALPDCTPDEMWMDPPSFAVKKKGNVKATKVFDTLEDAKQFVIDSAKELVIEERPSSPRRCDGNYCNVSQWCPQYAKWKESYRQVPSLED